MGRLLMWASASAMGCAGMRTAKVCCSAVTSLAKGESWERGSRIVNGPGQNLLMSGV